MRVMVSYVVVVLLCGLSCWAADYGELGLWHGPQAAGWHDITRQRQSQFAQPGSEYNSFISRAMYYTSTSVSHSDLLSRKRIVLFAIHGTFETGDPLLDTDAVDINGNFYSIVNADAGLEIQYDGLFRSQTITVYTGDQVMSVGLYFAVIRPRTTWATIPDIPTD